MKNTLKIIAFFMLIGISCRKDRQPISRFVETDISKDILFFEWAQARNGRWLPYALKKIKESNPSITSKAALSELDSFLKPVVTARRYYENELINKYKEHVSNLDSYLDSLYKYKYEEINESLHELKMMNGLYNKYEKFHKPLESKDIRLSSVSDSLNRDSLLEFVVTTCGLTVNLQAAPSLPLP